MATLNKLAPAEPPSVLAEINDIFKRKVLAVQRYAGGHGPPVAWADVERAASQAR